MSCCFSFFRRLSCCKPNEEKNSLLGSSSSADIKLDAKEIAKSPHATLDEAVKKYNLQKAPFKMPDLKSNEEKEECYRALKEILDPILQYQHGLAPTQKQSVVIRDYVTCSNALTAMQKLKGMGMNKAVAYLDAQHKSPSGNSEEIAADRLLRETIDLIRRVQSGTSTTVSASFTVFGF